MADLLSDEAAFGGVAAEPSWTEKAKNFVGMGEKKTPPKGLLSDADVFGGEALEQSFRDAAKPSALIGRGLKDTGERLGKGVAAAADMFLGIPGQALAVGANLGARGAAFVAGESRKVQGLAGEEAEQLIPEGLKTPIQTFIKTLGGGEALDQSIVSNQIESFANHLEKITGGKTTSEDVKAYINTFMMAGGAKVGDVGVTAGVKKLQSLEKSKPLVREEPAAVVDESPITDAEASAVSKQDVAAIFREAKKAGKEITTPEAKGVAEVNAFFEKAKQEGLARTNAEQIDYNTRPLAGLKAAEERIAALTPEQQTTLRAGLEKGAIDPELLKHMGYAAGGAAAATLGKALWNWYNEQNTVQVDDLFKKPPAKWSPYDPAGPDEDMQEPAPMRNGNYWTELGGAGALAAAVGAMKIKGEPASWHPRVLEELSTVLKSNAEALEGARGIEATSDRNVHAERMIQKHLNKWMGTAEDPLADVQIPYGEGTKSWKDVVDGATTVDSAAFYKKLALRKEGLPSFDKVPDTEKVFAMRNGEESVRLYDYLSHVGDYLREHVSPEKLQSYDLVRAVKETVKWDAELAKKMNDARLNDMKDATVYKAYPKEGMAWVELNKPGQFARESDAMGHSVRGYEPPKPPDVSLDPMNWYFDRKGTEGGFDAEAAARAGWRQATPEARAKFKTEIMESAAYKEYVRRINAAKPKTDWVEASGDSGHSHYGHGGWEAIKRGDAKVLSLRDLKTGESHATVEISKGGAVVNGRNGVPRGQTRYDVPDSISQIKGKQNRAPSEKYLPFIQDLVKSGKWGEVEDLGNTGLTKVRGKFMSNAEIAERAGVDTNIADAYMMGRIAPGESGYTNLAEFLTKGTERSRAQRGSADPRLLATIAAAGGVAAYLAANPDQQETLAAAGILGTTRGRVFNALKDTTRGLDIGLGRGTTRLANIEPELRRSTRDMELAAGKAITNASDKISTFIDAAKKLPSEKLAELESAYLKNDSGKIAEVFKGNVPLVAAYRELRNFLDATGKTLEGFNRFKRGITEYLPRVVKDYEGLMEALGGEAKVGLEKLLSEANTKMLRERQRSLTEVEQSVIINNWLRADPSMSHLPGFAKKRSVEMEKRLEPFYYNMEGSLIRYAHAAMEDVAVANFFGKDLRVSKSGQKAFTNVEESIGALTARLLNEKKITPEEAVDVQQILRARFGAGEKAPKGWIQDIRNVTGVATLGQIGSGLVQTSETLLSAYHHGAVPAIRSIATVLSGRGITPKEFGLANHVIEETIGKRASGQILSGVLKANLLATLDQLGMRQNLTASFLKNKKLVETKGGRAQLAAKWGADYGGDLPQLIKELQSSSVRQRTQLVDSLLYQELSDVRPTSRMEAPQLYNEHPDARFAYQLKMFMITQADILRRDAYNKIKTGDPREIAKGIKNLALFSGTLAVASIPADLIKAWINGQPIDLDKIDYVDNLARNFGLSRYGIDKIATSSKPAQAALEVAGNIVTPPVFSVAGQLGKSIDDPKKLVPLIPLGGRAYYNRELGGNEQKEKAEQKKRRLEVRDALEASNPILRDQRLARQAKAEAKKNAK